MIGKTMGYYDKQKTPEARIGQAIYHKALGDRRGFRPDQLGIDSDDEIWNEIFEAIAETVRSELEKRF